MKNLWKKDHPALLVQMMSEVLPGVLPSEHVAEVHPEIVLRVNYRLTFTLGTIGIDNELQIKMLGYL